MCYYFGTRNEIKVRHQFDLGLYTFDDGACTLYPITESGFEFM